ncbi:MULTISPECIES: lipoprotein-releasing ABC transporter permease subunit [unclassified Brevundimonas]|uniref:lipoprotein-releasing ABC transporter permease subunit n=1 Tax=unclassified Brevundimonas TaxID=2622653 RepID=UPI000CFAA595|nr:MULTISPECIES: lipoprotein-releasing ABC transporter permease subunit [unclassified Brevundimonas]PRA31983.1 lipoprotein-releasing system transmembrane subunit LolC [Brevundimonas sp. MYb27]PQZ82723.1 lipoprotein-releasing system transmembrane subunit LolC [Brevundimonas sp. MYb31]PRB16991.1 lipoprotein-releasing system transmembrane subunit LolC [Brevundimonas sp. MYb52]PRB37294.1 lipoprotein-releasing system transmembrane subunit LolC [Brevundimonas sp. MYb46]PRB48463.1 lipoprotein-releasi
MTDAATASAPPAVKPAGPFSAWEIGLALRYLRAKRKEGGVALIAIISFVGIMLAVAVLISVMSIMAGFRSELLGRMLSFNGHMYVQGPVLTSPDRDAAVKRISDVPGVVSVTPLTESPAMFRAGGQMTGGIVRGVRPQDLASTKFVYDSLTPEMRESFGRGQYGGDDILIGKALADQMGLSVGSAISIYSPTGADSAFGNLGGLEKTYRVGGIFSSGTADYDRAFIFMPLEQAQLFFGKEGVWDVIEMKVAEPDQVETLLTPVQQAAGPGSIVTDWRVRLAAFWGALKVERVAMSIILGLVVAIAAMNIISGIVMLVKNKTRDIAILRTVGASPSSILRIFFVSGAAIGIGGTIAGLVLGLLFCLNIGTIQHFLEGLLGVQLFNADVYMLDAIPALVDPWDVTWVAVFSFFMSCLASLPPSWNASRIDPVEALRFE